VHRSTPMRNVGRSSFAGSGFLYELGPPGRRLFLLFYFNHHL
jgi:hypothetical protein